MTCNPLRRCSQPAYLNSVFGFSRLNKALIDRHAVSVYEVSNPQCARCCDPGCDFCGLGPDRWPGTISVQLTSKLVSEVLLRLS